MKEPRETGGTPDARRFVRFGVGEATCCKTQRKRMTRCSVREVIW
jgi:hypothetical protein